MPVATGVDTSLLGLVGALGKIDAENRYTLFVNTADRRRFDGLLGCNMEVRPRCFRSRPVRLLFQQALLPAISLKERYDVVHSPSFLMPLWQGRGRHLLTIHDATFFSMPQLHKRLHRGSLFQRFVRESIQRADLINVPSNAVREELLRLFPGVLPERLRVTPWGIDPRFCPAPRAEVARHTARLRLPRRYILHVGTVEPRKNLLTLLESLRRLISSGDTATHLVLAGPGGGRASEVYRTATSPELRGRVHFTGYVADADLPWVYRGASLFAYPSLCEGFGFPPLEAMACGTAVVASLGSSLEENLEGAAELVDPTDSDALAATLANLLLDDARREQLIRLGAERARSFCWQQTARLVLDCYRELAGGQASAVARAARQKAS